MYVPERRGGGGAPAAVPGLAHGARPRARGDARPGRPRRRRRARAPAHHARALPVRILTLMLYICLMGPTYYDLLKLLQSQSTVYYIIMKIPIY